jgi:2-dehydro-3-deoxy-D-gluconate 5-dehydrogenase
MNPMFDLTGRVALVTGGNGGIGLGMALGLAQAGAAVVVVGRDTAKNADAVSQLGAKAFAVVADVTKKAECEAAVAAAEQKFGRLDILVANAGTSIRKQPQDFSEADWHHVIDTNLTSTLFSAQAAYPAMKRAGGGKVITIGSMMSIFGSSYAGAYAASKGGVVQLTRSLAVAWAPDNIQANCVLPGWIDTALTRKAREQVAGLQDKVLGRSPVGRWGVPADMSGVAVFLAAPASDFVTGTAIPVDGGFSVMG